MTRWAKDESEAGAVPPSVVGQTQFLVRTASTRAPADKSAEPHFERTAEGDQSLPARRKRSAGWPYEYLAWSNPGYSIRSAVAGSTRVARRAGSHAPASAATTSNPPTAVSVTGSSGETP